MAVNEERGVFEGDSNYEFRDGVHADCGSCYVDYAAYDLGNPDNRRCEVTAEMDRQNMCKMNSYYSRCNNKKSKSSRISRMELQRQTDVRPIIDVRLQPNGKVYDQEYQLGDELVMYADHSFGKY